MPTNAKATRLKPLRTAIAAFLALLALVGVVMIVVAFATAPTPPASATSVTGPNVLSSTSANTPTDTPPSSNGPSATSNDGPTTPNETNGALTASPPTRLRIPAIGVDAPTGSVGVEDKNGVSTLEVPPFDQPGLTAWYRLGPTPGENGNSVIVGHVDTKAGPAVFYRLAELKAGDRLAVTRQDGTIAHFAIDKVVLYPNTSLPLGEIYGSSKTPGLRLITCGGAYDKATKSYEGNVVAYASLRTPTS